MKNKKPKVKTVGVYFKCPERLMDEVRALCMQKNLTIHEVFVAAIFDVVEAFKSSKKSLCRRKTTK
jgi:ABC-type uncharacterized transport system substrate-binding protein